jgi:hypothetical protein
LAVAIASACGSSAGTKASSTAVAPVTSVSAATTGATEATDTSTTLAGAEQEIIVHVGVDDAATLGSRVEHVAQGHTVVLRLVSDGDENYVIPGYNLRQRVAAGVEAQFEFQADKAGSFPVQSTVTNKTYLVLEVA